MSEKTKGSTPMLRNIRKDFIKGMLVEDEADKDPVAQFSAWLDFAFRTNELANAMVLSTADGSGVPDSRVMLLRDATKEGLTFFSNYESKKARDLARNKNASVLFFWPDLERQVRIAGIVKKLSARESDAYFASRPFESRVGALVSAQSTVIRGRMQMDEAFAAALKKYAGGIVPRPAHWGGYILKPSVFEFWQGRANRMHDRLRYVRKNKKWTMERLMP